MKKQKNYSSCATQYEVSGCSKYKLFKGNSAQVTGCFKQSFWAKVLLSFYAGLATNFNLWIVLQRHCTVLSSKVEVQQMQFSSTFS